MNDDIVAHWVDTNEMRTHSEKCWQWHPSCAIALLGDENARLRALITAWVDADDRKVTNVVTVELGPKASGPEDVAIALRKAVGR